MKPSAEPSVKAKVLNEGIGGNECSADSTFTMSRTTFSLQVLLQLPEEHPLRLCCQKSGKGAIFGYRINTTKQLNIFLFFKGKDNNSGKQHIFGAGVAYHHYLITVLVSEPAKPHRVVV